MSAGSRNFIFLAAHDQLLDQLGALAERYFADDPNTCLLKLRQLGEALAQRAAASAGLYHGPEETQIELLGRLRLAGVLDSQVADLFHGLRKAGNAAAHSGAGDHGEALHQLKMARQVAIWFHRTFGDPAFKPGPFVPPPDPAAESRSLAEELRRLRAALAAQQTAAEAAQRAAAEAAEARLSAEEKARQAAEERALWEELAGEASEAQKRLSEDLARVQAASAAAPASLPKAQELGAAAAAQLELDEADTRRLIDEQLRRVGWDVDSERLTYASGARPLKGKNLAIAEWPTETGPADYVLFVGLTPVAVVEAKRKNKDVSASIEQAKRYSRGYLGSTAEASPGGPWGRYRVPFLFATNGRPYLKQVETKSGIWFLDARRAENLSRALPEWYSPQGLAELLKQDIDRANEALKAEPTDYLDLRDYQLKAIGAVERAIESGRRTVLLAMATGTGKTRTALGLIYRLIKTKRFRRVLFLVDREALGEQAGNTFKEVKLEDLKTFAEIFDIKGLRDVRPEPDTKLHIATIQGMVKRVLGTTEDNRDQPTVDQYDCIIVDECHRGYLLDRELSETELGFRNQEDYVSTYRRVLEYFDAVKIGLTATPALHTTEIFGLPVFQYSYREAVIDGVLIDHEPPIRIITKLAEDGMHWDAGSEMLILRSDTQTLDVIRLPDEVDLEVESFNKRVISENFNRVVADELAKRIDPSLEGKTLVFCVNDSHADLFVRVLKEALQARYGEIEDDAVLKITGSADKVPSLIRRFKNERNPRVAVTVDLLTTGIDVPAITNIVFVRRVKSRILYEQMLGRATRRCDEIGKDVYRIYDAVDLYKDLEPYTSMKPVVVDPKITFAQLVTEVVALADEAQRAAALEQLIAKLQGKRALLDTRIHDVTGLSAKEFIERLRAGSPADAGRWLAEHPSLGAALDLAPGSRGRTIVSQHDDEVRRVEQGYGGAEQPSDYLEGFAAYLHSHVNEVPALLAVTQRPRDLTRKALRELKLALDQAGYSEVAIQTAWRQMTNQDIAASIIGFIRQAALGDPLVPYGDRVDRALKSLLAKHAFTDPQRQWLKKIAAQLKQEVVVDREALDQGAFQRDGGFARLNKVFDGKLDDVLGDLQEQIWKAGP